MLWPCRELVTLNVSSIESVDYRLTTGTKAAMVKMIKKK